MKIFMTVLIFVLIGGINFADDVCPKANVISKMDSSMDSFKAVQPLDFSKIKSSGGLIGKNGDKLAVCLSNGDFNTKQMTSDFVVPIKKKDEFIAVLHFSNAKKKLVPGTYSAAAGYGKPLWVHAEVKLFKGEKGVIVSLGVREGTATIDKLTDEMACGKFNLKTKSGSSTKGIISGEFSVKLEKSRW